MQQLRAVQRVPLRTSSSCCPARSVIVALLFSRSWAEMGGTSSKTSTWFVGRDGGFVSIPWYCKMVNSFVLGELWWRWDSRWWVYVIAEDERDGFWEAVNEDSQPEQIWQMLFPQPEQWWDPKPAQWLVCFFLLLCGLPLLTWKLRLGHGAAAGFMGVMG